MSKYVGNILTDGAATGYSCGFNAGKYLTITNAAALNPGTGDFTFEAFAYAPSSLASTSGSIFEGQAGGFSLSNNTSGYITVNNSYVSTLFTSSVIFPTGQWVHLAVSRSGTTLSLFQNGVRVSTGSNSTNFVTGTLNYIGKGGSSGGEFPGFISNLRMIKGTAIYDPTQSTINVPTQLFAITNTSLLTCQQPTIIDTSSNAFAITNTGGVTVSNFSPFPAYQAYNPASGGGTPGIWSLNDAAYAAQNQSWNMYDPYWRNTTLLLNGENAANGAQNNTFLDSSTNNFTITRNGNTTQGTFSPYGDLWSNYFDGSGDTLTIASSTAFGVGTGDFTLECWVCCRFTGVDQAIIDFRTALDAQPWAFSVSTTGLARTYDGATVRSGGQLNENTWNHVAWVRQNNVNSVYVNGTLGHTWTLTRDLQSSRPVCIGGSLTVEFFTGYISNLRLVKGTAVYTSNFTPSTTPLTAISGTSLLTCQSNRFKDNSSNNFAITVNGNTSVQRFSPFNPTAPYSASTIGGSGYFDGTGDYLIVGGGSSNAYNFGTGNATVEAWINTTAALGVIASNYDSWSGTVTDAWRLLIGQGTSGRAEWSQGSTIVAFNPKLVNDGAWHHVAAVINGGSVTIYVDGIGGTSVSLSGYNYTKTTDMYVGAYYAAEAPIQIPFTGYISNLRINKGNAVYTTNFTPPTAPVTAISGTTALLNFTNAGIPDAAMMNDLETVGNAQVSTSVKKYGTGSLAFDGSGDGLALPANVNLALGTGNFTIEMWIYGAATSSIVGGSYTGPFALGTLATSGSFEVYFGSSSTTYVYTGTGGGVNLISFSTATILNNTWNHFAITRDGTTLKAFVNGTQVGSTATDSNNYSLAATSVSYVGSRAAAAGNFNGYIDDFRITKGVARYTSNFTPPTSSLQNL